ncbi:MAG: peptidase S10, partial [Terracidiphilus sp.]
MQHRACSRWFAALAIGVFAASFACAQNNAAPSAAKSEGKSEAKITPDAPADSITEGSLKVGGQTIEYRAIAGTLTVGST